MLSYDLQKMFENSQLVDLWFDFAIPTFSNLNSYKNIIKL